MEPQFAYVFTGNKIIEKKILQYQKIDDSTTFVKIEDFGPIVFDKGLQKIKKGEVYIALDKRVFGDEILMSAKLELQAMHNTKNYHLKKIKECEDKIRNAKSDIDCYKKRILNCDHEILELKAVIGERMKLKNELSSN